MTLGRVDCWLQSDGGARIPVDERGVVLGRGLGAEVHLPDPRASRRHALVHVDTEGAQVVQLGRRAILVNREPVGPRHRLVDGCSLDLPGRRFTVHVRIRPNPPQSTWVLRDASGAYIELPMGSSTIGGSDTDGIPISGWPDACLQVELTNAGLLARTDKSVFRNGRLIPRAEATTLGSGDSLRYRSVTVTILALARSQETTIGVDEEGLPWQIQIQPLPPAGGQVTILVGRDETTSFLPGLRFDLMQVLLQPPKGHNAGDWLPDAIVEPLVWGRQVPDHPKALTTLVRRLRDDLRRTGVDGAFLERRSWRTRFRVGRKQAIKMLPPR